MWDKSHWCDTAQTMRRATAILGSVSAARHVWQQLRALRRLQSSGVSRTESAMMLRRLAWASVPSPSFSPARLNEIIAPSRRNNERHQISGMLLFTGAHFLSMLEGEERKLDDLWLRLARDQRHCELFRIGDESCVKRLYPEWMMGYMVDAQVDAQIESLRSLQARVDMDRARAGAPARSRRSPQQVRSAPRWAGNIQRIMVRADSM